jgi:hypothetical protein
MVLTLVQLAKRENMRVSEWGVGKIEDIDVRESWAYALHYLIVLTV